jgi:catechol 2,3-dioxygenase-like lactoylglutathione lyase family enzyme
LIQIQEKHIVIQLDHVVISVSNLDEAVADYRRLGFTVLPGGEHASGTTHNALVVLADGTYLELMALTGRDSKGGADYSFLHHEGEGFVAYALRVEDLSAAEAELKGRSVSLKAPSSGGRARPDGQVMRWNILNLEGGGMSPFIIQDETPRTLRVPDHAEATTHENKLVGIAGLYIPVQDLEAAKAKYSALLGVEMEMDEKNYPVYRLGNFFIGLRQTDTVRNPQVYGEVPDRVIFDSLDPVHSRQMLGSGHSHGAVLIGG